MAEEILVKEPLTREMIEAGAELLRRLDEIDLDVVAAFWFYTSETNKWKLMLACPSVDTEGQKAAYGKIWDVLYGRPDGVPGIESTDTVVLSPSETTVKALAGVNRLGNLTNKRLPRSNFGDIYVEDIYVYFVKDSVKPLAETNWYV